jgi:hypothetical protein
LTLLGESVSIEHSDRALLVILAKQGCELCLPLGLGQPFIIEHLELNDGFAKQIIRTGPLSPIGIGVGAPAGCSFDHCINIRLCEGAYAKLIHSRDCNGVGARFHQGGMLTSGPGV